MRKHGPKYMKALAIKDITSKLQDFVTENFGYISNSVFFGPRDDRTLNLVVSEKEKNDLTQALSSSSIFNPQDELTVFPLVTIRSEKAIKTSTFFFSSPEDVDPFFLGKEKYRAGINPKVFPPDARFEGSIHPPASWLGVYSPDYRYSFKIRSAVLGAVALAPLHQYRYMFSGRKVFGGRCTITSTGIECSFGQAHTPACMEDIVLTDKDTAWLELLSDKIQYGEEDATREINALEYFYRAWPQPPNERFPILCMSIDALLGRPKRVTQSIVDGVRDTLGEHISEPQLKSILKLRAQIIHGVSPDIYDSDKYPEYYQKYGSDPVHDMELIVGECLRRKIFKNKFVEQPDPHAEIIEDEQKAGRLPPNLFNRSILNPRD